MDDADDESRPSYPVAAQSDDLRQLHLSSPAQSHNNCIPHSYPIPFLQDYSLNVFNIFMT